MSAVRFFTAIHAVVTGVGVALTLGSGYLVIRGPFLGGAPLDPVTLLGMLGVFIVGVIVLAWGSTKLAYDLTRR